jgi:hypothetical protein
MKTNHFALFFLRRLNGIAGLVLALFLATTALAQVDRAVWRFCSFSSTVQKPLNQPASQRRPCH